MKQLLLIFFVLLFFNGCVTDNYVLFSPVYKESDMLVASDEQLTVEYKENVKFVLDYYEVPYRENNNGEILIPEKIWNDQDLIWNYTTKANDPSWLNSR